jgi:hypothetical protein
MELLLDDSKLHRDSNSPSGSSLESVRVHSCREPKAKVAIVCMASYMAVDYGHAIHAF